MKHNTVQALSSAHRTVIVAEWLDTQQHSDDVQHSTMVGSEGLLSVSL